MNLKLYTKMLIWGGEFKIKLEKGQQMYLIYIWDAFFPVFALFYHINIK